MGVAPGLGVGQVLLAVLLVGSEGVLFHRLPHHLLKGQLAHKVLDIHMDVQLGSQGKAGGGVPACASQPAHTQDKFNGPGPMAVLRHPQQSAQQAPGDVHPSSIRVADTLHVFQDQAAQQHSTADDVLFVGNAGGVGALDVQDAFEAADEIGALDGLEAVHVLRGLGKKFREGGGGGTRKDKDRPRDGQGAAVQGVFPVLHGGQEILQPAPGDPAQLGVKLVEEDQGDQPVFIAQSLMEGVEELGDRVVLGQVQGGDAEPAPAQGDLLDAEGLAGARRSEDGDGDWLGGVLPCVPVVICIDVLVQQGLDGVVVLDLPRSTVDRTR